MIATSWCSGWTFNTAHRSITVNIFCFLFVEEVDKDCIKCSLPIFSFYCALKKKILSVNLQIIKLLAGLSQALIL